MEKDTTWTAWCHNGAGQADVGTSNQKDDGTESTGRQPTITDDEKMGGCSEGMQLQKARGNGRRRGQTMSSVKQKEGEHASGGMKKAGTTWC